MTLIAPELLRFVANGVLATTVHYAVLSIGLNVLGLPSAALANMLGAVFGIGASFLGNRYFVFRQAQGTLAGQFLRFSGLYGAIALLHGLVLLLWTDWQGWDYRLGFVLATGLQVTLSYLGNKFLVFKT